MTIEEIRNSKYETRTSLAARLGVSSITIDRALADGRLGCHKVGRRVLISADHISDFLAKQERKASAK